MKNPTQKSNWKVYALLTLLLAAVAAVSVLLFCSSMQTRSVVTRYTTAYLADVSGQMASSLDSRLLSSARALQIIRDSAIRFSEEEAEAFLERRQLFSGYDELRMFRSAGEAEAWVREAYPEIDPQMRMTEEGACLLFVPGEEALLHCVQDPEGKDPAILVGIEDGEMLQALLETENFGGAGGSLVAGADGSVVAMPRNNGCGAALAALWETGGQGETQQALERMRTDAAGGTEGTVSLPETQAGSLLVHYEPLEYPGWSLITAIPESAVSDGIDRISLGNRILTGAVILVLFLSLLLALSNSRRRRELERITFSDQLTCGMNDTRFCMVAGDLLERHRWEYVLVSMDIQDFKFINKAFGTQQGNRTLQHVYRILSAALQEEEPLARDCGDVFYFLLKERDEARICSRLQQIFQQVNQFNTQQEAPYVLELYFGIYAPQGDGESIQDMQEKANLARKRKKGDQRYRYSFYDEELQQKLLEEKDLMGMVEGAVRKGEFVVYLQPKVRLADQRIVGAEALIRWNHPERGLLAPADFIPAAERHHQICRLDRLVFEEICRILARWKQEGRELPAISVNLSRQNLESSAFLREYRELCLRYEVSPSLIEFELTETILFENPKGVRACIDEMHAMGFQCSLDDFGAGFSSLGLLNDLDVDTIKLDRSFFWNKRSGQRSLRIVEAILKLAAQLHIRTVAEGIDDAGQVAYLRRAACDLVQGFFFFKPMPVEEFEATAFEEGRLRYMPPLDKMSAPLEREGPEDLLHMEEQPNSGLVAFSYDVKRDRAVFSAPFSPVMEGRCDFQAASAFFRKSELIHDSDREDFFRVLERCRREDIWVETTLRFYMSQGRYEWLELFLHNDGDSGYLSGVLINLAHWRSELDRWREKANRDALTGLYNREFLEQYVREQLKDGSLTSAALIFIDIDDFKRANDTLGHVVGDDILCCVAKRALGVFRHSDIVARYGGDEFLIFVPSVGREILRTRLEQLCGVFHYPYRNGTLHYQISGSIGAALYPEGGLDYETLLKHADAALYAAKSAGKDRYVLYEPEQPLQGGE